MMKKTYLALFLLMLIAFEVKGTTFIVDIPNDELDSSCIPGDCSLREAIQDAMANPGSDDINFSGSLTTINLSLGCLTINDLTNAPLNITGNVTINTTGTNSAFCIFSSNVKLENLTVQGNTGAGQAIIYVQGASGTTLLNLTVQNNQNGGGIYFDGVSAPTPPSATVDQCVVKQNGSSGIQILNSSRVYVTNSQIYKNGQEGVLIKNSSENLVDSNYIGTDSASTGPENDPIASVLPNQNSGVAIISENNGESKGNSILKNRIAYNRYQNILLSGSGVHNNQVETNQVYSDFCRDPNLPATGLNPNNGIVISNEANNNTVKSNRIECHFYNGVQVVGPKSDGNKIIQHYGTNITGVFGTLSSSIENHGTSILITNDYNNTTFPTTSSSSPIPSGPKSTFIEKNLIDGAKYHGIHVILSKSVYIYSNIIKNTKYTGILMVGSQGGIGIDQNNYPAPNTITPNYTNNGSAGIRVEAHYGSDTNYQNHSDDTNSDLEIKNNDISNCDFGIIGLDNEIDSNQNPSQLNSTNTISSTTWARVLQQWFGIVEILDASNNPITSITAGAITSPTCPWDNRDLQAYNNGAWGPSGLNLYNVYTWAWNGLLLTDDYVDNSGTYTNCNPRKIIAYAAPLYATELFSFDGDSNTHPVSPDPGLPFSSPVATQNGRYQIAQVRLLSPSSAEVTITGKVRNKAGRGIPYVEINVFGSSNQRRVRTNLLGEYRLSLQAGQTYVIRAQSKRYRFTPEEYVLYVQEDMEGIDFTALERGVISKKGIFFSEGKSP